MSRGENTKERIIAVTAEFLETRSAQFFSLQDIAQRAGVSRALIIRHFKSKDELVFVTILRGLNDRGSPLLETLHANGQIKSYRGLVEHLFEVDIVNGQRTRDLMSMSWWWMASEEDAFQDSIGVRLRLLHHYLRLEAPAQAPPSAVEDLSWMASLVYTERLRIALVRGSTPREVAAQTITQIEAMLVALRVLHPGPASCP